MTEPATPQKTGDKMSGAESPTTARPIDFDDEQQETGVINQDGNPTRTVKSPPLYPPGRGVHFDEEAPPPKPPRPMSPQAEKEATLIEAFPDIDSKVIKAVLVASNGQVEPAFNALLSMSDPDYQEEQPPPQPPRPAQTAQQRQLHQDEMYARQLAQHYQASGAPRYPGQGDERPPAQPRRPSQPEGQKEYSFLDDELPEIRKNIQQGFLQTQTKVNKWISDFKKRIDGEEPSVDPYTGTAAPQGFEERQNFGSSTSDQMQGIRRAAEAQRAHAARRSVDANRYDADPQLISDNFTELELHDDEAEGPPPKKPARPLANPDLFKPTPPPPQSGPVDEVDAMDRRAATSTTGVAAKGKKWQPLTSVAPAPDVEGDDPFALGDSDDELKELKSKDVAPEDTERLKKKASQNEGSTSDNIALEEASKSGTKNSEAEALMK